MIAESDISLEGKPLWKFCTNWKEWTFIWNEDLNELSSCINHTNAITLQKYAQNYEKLLYTNGLINTLVWKLEVKNKSIVWDH